MVAYIFGARTLIAPQRVRSARTTLTVHLAQKQQMDVVGVRRRELVWMCPTQATFVELLMFAPTAVFTMEVQITIAHQKGFFVPILPTVLLVLKQPMGVAGVRRRERVWMCPTQATFVGLLMFAPTVVFTMEVQIRIAHSKGLFAPTTRTVLLVQMRRMDVAGVLKPIHVSTSPTQTRCVVLLMRAAQAVFTLEATTLVAPQRTHFAIPTPIVKVAQKHRTIARGVLDRTSV